MKDSMGFKLISNVEIQVVDRKRNIIRQTIKKHNKATRSMITGLIRFLVGQFNASSINSKPYYKDTEQYIPCYIGFGDGGVVLDAITGNPSYDPETKIPNMESWNETVPYTANKLVREFFVVGNSTNGSRARIRKVTTTLGVDPAGDMDTIYMYCEVNPGELNSFYAGSPVILSEIGLFASSIPGTKDLLAYVKLGNYTDEETGDPATRTLYVRSEDTVVVKWYITMVAVGDFNPEESTENIVPNLTTLSMNELTEDDIPFDEDKITFKYTKNGQPMRYETDLVGTAKGYTQYLNNQGVTDAYMYCGDGVDYTLVNNGTVKFAATTCLQKVRLPNTLTAIPDSFLNDSVNLKEVVFGNAVTSIGYYAFAYCNNLSRLVLPDTLTTIGDFAFFKLDGGAFNQASLNIPPSVTSIGEEAFAYLPCHHILFSPSTTYTITFGKECFMGCYYLSSFAFPKGTTSIPRNIFNICGSMTDNVYTGLKTITIPSTVTSIDSLAFYSDYTANQTKLETIYLGNASLISGQPWGASPAPEVIV